MRCGEFLEGDFINTPLLTVQAKGRQEGWRSIDHQKNVLHFLHKVQRRYSFLCLLIAGTNECDENLLNLHFLLILYQ